MPDSAQVRDVGLFNATTLGLCRRGSHAMSLEQPCSLDLCKVEQNNKTVAVDPLFHRFLLSSWNPSVKENINLSQSSPYFRSSIRSIPNFCPTKSSHVCHGTRPQAVEALSWAELAEVALAYASLRLYSQSLFGAGAHFWWCGRICQERGEHCLKLHSLVFWLLCFFFAKIQPDVGVLDKSDKS